MRPLKGVGPENRHRNLSKVETGTVINHYGSATQVKHFVPRVRGGGERYRYEVNTSVSSPPPLVGNNSITRAIERGGP
jgi:hypothetical protein